MLRGGVKWFEVQWVRLELRILDFEVQKLFPPCAVLQKGGIDVLCHRF